MEGEGTGACAVCILNFTSTTRIPIQCSKCNFVACKKCVGTFFDKSTCTKICCMNCSTDFDSQQLKKIGPKNIKPVKKRKLDEIVLQEKGKIGETMYILQAREEENVAVRELENDRNDTNRIRAALQESIMKENATKNKIFEIRKRSSSLNFLNSENRKNTFPCPCGDCLGLVTDIPSGSNGDVGNRSSECEVCNTRICLHCRNVNTTDHTCNPSEVESVDTVKKSTRNCPVCAKKIYKIDGCDDMWCTQCRTPFSWNTGTVIRGRFHNPHFQRWQNENATNVVAMATQCAPGLAISWLTTPQLVEICVSVDIEGHHRMNPLATCFIVAFFEFLGSIRDKIPLKEQYKIELGELRIQFIKKTITEDVWRKKIEAVCCKDVKRYTVIQFYETLLYSGHDLVERAIMADDRGERFDALISICKLLQISKETRNNIVAGEKVRIVNFNLKSSLDFEISDFMEGLLHREGSIPIDYNIPSTTRYKIPQLVKLNPNIGHLYFSELN